MQGSKGQDFFQGKSEKRKLVAEQQAQLSEDQECNNRIWVYDIYSGEKNLRLLWSDSPIARVPGMAFFFSGPKPGLPPVLQVNLTLEKEQSLYTKPLLRGQGR